jgi:hypothetical protein
MAIACQLAGGRCSASTSARRHDRHLGRAVRRAQASTAVASPLRSRRPTRAPCGEHTAAAGHLRSLEVESAVCRWRGGWRTTR